jgi:hypothetical protein
LLDKQERKFDEMLTIAHSYAVEATMAARQLLSHGMLMSIIFEHYEQLRPYRFVTDGIIMFDCMMVRLQPIIPPVDRAG